MSVFEIHRRRVPRLDIEVTPLQVPQLLDQVRNVAEQNGRLLIGAHNLHSAYLFHTIPAFADFYSKANIIVVDGSPVLALLNGSIRRSSRGQLGRNSRFGSTDWILKAAEISEVERICVLGASKSSNAEFLKRVKEIVPGKCLLGIPTDPWLEEGLDEITNDILRLQPDLTLIAMGMPLQERIALHLISSGLRGAVATVGGAIDQLSGHQYLAPRWTGKFGVEWLWRLISDPRRLSRRYLIEPVKLIRLLRSRRIKS